MYILIYFIYLDVRLEMIIGLEKITCLESLDISGNLINEEWIDNFAHRDIERKEFIILVLIIWLLSICVYCIRIIICCRIQARPRKNVALYIIFIPHGQGEVLIE